MQHRISIEINEELTSSAPEATKSFSGYFTYEDNMMNSSNHEKIPSNICNLNTEILFLLECHMYPVCDMFESEASVTTTSYFSMMSCKINTFSFVHKMHNILFNIQGRGPLESMHPPDYCFLSLIFHWNRKSKPILYNLSQLFILSFNKRK